MIRHLEGLHLTATNRAHLAAILARGWTRGETRALSYQLEPCEDAPGEFAYTISKKERDDWGRPIVRQSRGRISWQP